MDVLLSSRTIFQSSAKGEEGYCNKTIMKRGGNGVACGKRKKGKFRLGIEVELM